MTDDQQRARELWSDALRKVGQHEYAYHVGCGGDLNPSEQATLDAITAALRAAPEGFVLVPVEPTPEMLEATSWPECARTDYAHMLAACPQVQP